MPRDNKPFPLPDFSDAVQPLLNGHTLSVQDRAKLSSTLKNELLSYLNDKKLIMSGNSALLRWQYRNLGHTLALKYPKMLWDYPGQRKKKFNQKKVAPVYAVFIRRLSQRRKMQRLRGKGQVCESHMKPKDIIREASGYDLKTDPTLTVPQLQKNAVPSGHLTPAVLLIKSEVDAAESTSKKNQWKENLLNDETDGSQLGELAETYSGSESENVTETSIVIKQELTESNAEWPSQVVNDIIYAEDLVPSSSSVPSSSNLPSSSSQTSSRTPLSINAPSLENVLPVANPDSTNADQSSATNNPEKKRKRDNVKSSANDSISSGTVVKLHRLENPSTSSEGGGSSQSPSGIKKSAGRTIPPSAGTRNTTREVFETLMNCSNNNPMPGTRARKKPSDLFDVFSDFIADKLREMEWDNCAFALRSILDIVFKAGQDQQSSREEESDIFEPGSSSDQE